MAGLQQRGRVEGRGEGPTKEATEEAEPGLRASRRAGGAPAVLQGSGRQGQGCPVTGGIHSWAFVCKGQTHPRRVRSVKTVLTRNCEQG